MLKENYGPIEDGVKKPSRHKRLSVAKGNTSVCPTNEVEWKGVNDTWDVRRWHEDNKRIVGTFRNRLDKEDRGSHGTKWDEIGAEMTLKSKYMGAPKSPKWMEVEMHGSPKEPKRAHNTLETKCMGAPKSSWNIRKSVESWRKVKKIHGEVSNIKLHSWRSILNLRKLLGRCEYLWKLLAG